MRNVIEVELACIGIFTEIELEEIHMNRTIIAWWTGLPFAHSDFGESKV